MLEESCLFIQNLEPDFHPIGNIFQKSCCVLSGLNCRSDVYVTWMPVSFCLIVVQLH